MRSVQHVVTIDGLRGTGKSTLANSVRTEFGCDIIDVGPIFRLTAWIMHSRRIRCVEVSQALLQGFKQGDISINTQVAGMYAASSIIAQGLDSEQTLWSPKFDRLIRFVAKSPEVIDVVSRIVEDYTRDRRIIVVGREVGTKLIPSADLKIVLTANDKIRRSRKKSQLLPSANSKLFSKTERSEPHKSYVHDDDSFIIDTTFNSPIHVQKEVSDLLQEKLGW